MAGCLGITDSSGLQRSCGDCDVCCTAMNVTALNKPAGTRCKHMKTAGCSIYLDRPATCRDWYCMWVRDRHGIFSEAERPDRVGLFLTASRPDPDGQQTIYAHPIRPDALQRDPARRLLSRLRQFVTVCELPYRSEASRIALTFEGHPLEPSAA